ncbi:MAG: nucleotide disphospho-sugar-binding domain-containing protein [Massilia sp.]
MIHHGGIGTTAEALRAATPQLIVPLAHDQFDNGARVAALGAGLVLPAARLDPARLTRRLRELLGAPAIAAGCQAAAAHFATPFDSAALVSALEVLSTG